MLGSTSSSLSGIVLGNDKDDEEAVGEADLVTTGADKNGKTCGDGTWMGSLSDRASATAMALSGVSQEAESGDF